MSTHPTLTYAHERRLRHAPPRELTTDELREALERRMLSEQLFDIELRRREFANRMYREVGHAF